MIYFILLKGGKGKTERRKVVVSVRGTRGKKKAHLTLWSSVLSISVVWLPWRTTTHITVSFFLHTSLITHCSSRRFKFASVSNSRSQFQHSFFENHFLFLFISLCLIWTTKLVLRSQTVVVRRARWEVRVSNTFLLLHHLLVLLPLVLNSLPRFGHFWRIQDLLAYPLFCNLRFLRFILSFCFLFFW